MSKLLMNLFCALMLMTSIVATPANAEDVRLTWDAPDDDRVVGYNVYVGPNDPPTVDNGGTVYDAGTATNYTVTGLTVGETYLLGATSYDVDGNESVMSGRIQYTVVERPGVTIIPQMPKSFKLELNW